jgi:tetratricopeptide (TPR) repeat protein
LLAVALVGIVIGLSQLVGGAYDEATWGPVTLAVLAMLLASAIGAPRRLPLLALLALLALLGLALWSLISTGWSESADAARIAANRWLLYAASFALLLRLVAGERRRKELRLLAAAAAIAGVTIGMLVQMIRGHGAALFLGNRLNDPLGYVNGQAGYLLAGVWPCCAVAERRGPAVRAGLALSALVAMVAVGTLARSRSYEIALIVSAVTVVVAIPGRRRRLTMLLVGAAAIFAIRQPLAAVSHHPVATDAAVRHAAIAVVIAALAAGAIWAAAVELLERIALPGSQRRNVIARLAGGALVVLILAAVAVAGLNHKRIVHSARDQFHAFTHLSGTAGTDRLLSGAGNRYDYWRVAWIEFRSEPLRGVGAGNYQPGYYRDRRTTEAIEQPHSIELQTLAELGLVGAALLAAFLGLIAVGAGRAIRRTRADSAARPLAVAATGVFVAWLVQTSVDWEHLIPGLTIIALAGAAALLSDDDPLGMRATQRTHQFLIAAYAGLACAGALMIVPRILTLHSQSAALRALQDHRPVTAIADATRALDYDASSVPALTLRAAGFARLGAFAQARDDLRRALVIEPQNWVTYALMGDLYTRRGERAAARVFYRHALSLDPLEPSLIAALASHQATRRR